MAEKVEVKKDAAQSDRAASVYRVSVNGRQVGRLEKIADGRGSRYPWRAFVMTGAAQSRHVGNYRTEEGGKAAARAALLAAWSARKAGA